ncbi:MAG TPA: hypothetical protein VFZ75_00025 [Actinomycetota bacterium]|nr:hypothetical protein [Actinomycetota bacterium]
MSSTSTRPRDATLGELTHARTYRRVGLVALAIVVLAGLLNLLGVRHDVVSAEAEGYRLAIEYARVTRPGLASPWKVEVTRPGGFDGPITLAMSADYFDRFDFNQFYPEPTSTTSRGDVVLWTFEGIEGDRLVVRFDGRATPAFTLGLAAASTALEIDGRQIVRVDYTTVVMP